MKVLVTLFMLAVLGCGHVSSPKTDDEIVAERAQAWLDALLRKRVDQAWEYTSPAYRAGNGPGRYTKHIAGASNWTDAYVQQVSCVEDRCEVSYMITYKLPQFNLENTRPLKSVWIKVDGKWWLYQK